MFGGDARSQPSSGVDWTNVHADSFSFDTNPFVPGGTAFGPIDLSGGIVSITSATLNLAAGAGNLAMEGQLDVSGAPLNLQGAQTVEGFRLRAPGGGWWRLNVDDSGALTVVPG